MIMESAGFRIKRMVEKRAVTGGQAADSLGLLLQLLEQHRQNERARVVIRAVAFGKIRHRQKRVLENAGGIRHAREMIEPEGGQFARLLIEGFGGEGFSGEQRALKPRSF